MFGLQQIVALCLGSILGGLSRYSLSLALNGMFPPIPAGTLVCNLIAAWVVGAAIAFFAAMPCLSPAWRLFVITGFAGGLSTFSTFSAELLNLLRDGRFGWSGVMLLAHVGGSLLMVAVGMATVALLRNS